jgi:2-dehydropantoate 2-reductase
VHLVGRPQHVEAVNERGLILETSDFTEAVRVTASQHASGVAGADIVLFCVKSNDTLTAGAEIAPHLKNGATILSLQNGVDNAERLQARLNRPVVPVAVYVAAEMATYGHVRHHGRGELIIGPCPASAETAAAFERPGFRPKFRTRSPRRCGRS